MIATPIDEFRRIEEAVAQRIMMLVNAPAATNVVTLEAQR
jgi:hypothetical protein